MKKSILLMILFNILFVNLYSQSRYWEDMSKIEKNRVTDNKQINIYILKIYQGKYDIDKDENDNRVDFILKTLTENKNDSLKAFYFFVFNQVCTKSSGECFREMLGDYCKTIVQNNPQYIFEYFTKRIKRKDLKLFNSYTSFIGERLFSPDIETPISEDYISFKNALNKSSIIFSNKEKKL